jgi:hypothetical protein
LSNSNFIYEELRIRYQKVLSFRKQWKGSFDIKGSSSGEFELSRGGVNYQLGSWGFENLELSYGNRFLEEI